ncbi:hypothetical protein FRC17_002224 [Serendipita sp. 399]|nr:hypothetical protein FRC17_002224 [Serendipita sp. 399]
MAARPPTLIQIKVLAAMDLVKRDVFKRPDVFVRVSILVDGSWTERQTKVVEDSTSPVWNETFVMSLSEDTNYSSSLAHPTQILTFSSDYSTLRNIREDRIKLLWVLYKFLWLA